MSAREIVVDSFAGGGGASLGIERAIDRSPDIAINHDAVLMGARNKVERYETTSARGRSVDFLAPEVAKYG